MYCPNCGQQQISDEMRFCSRCGLALTGLAEWLASGVLPAPRTETKTSPDSPRKKGMRRAAKLMFITGALFPFFLAMSIGIDEPGPLVIGFGLFFISSMLLIYARLFSDPSPRALPNHTAQTSALGSVPPRAYLHPQAANPPMPDIGRQRVRTNELAQPPSVTENTTRLLDNE